MVDCRRPPGFIPLIEVADYDLFVRICSYRLQREICSSLFILPDSCLHSLVLKELIDIN